MKWGLGEKLAQKDSEIAFYKSQDTTNGKLTEVVDDYTRKFEARDTTLTGALIELGKESVRNEYARADIAALKVTVAEHGKQLCELTSSVSTLGERVTGVAMSLNQKIEAQGRELAQAIGLEAERRECADNNIYSYINGNFVPGKLNINPADICPQVQLKCPDVDLVQIVTSAVQAAVAKAA